MKFIGQEEIWDNIKKANAISRTWNWFQIALLDLKDLISNIPAKIIATITSFTLQDIVTIARAFQSISNNFVNLPGELIKWGINNSWKLMEIVFDVISPGALTFIKQTGLNFYSILKNPLPFVGNLANAAKLGFQNFAAHFSEHFQRELLNWLLGVLPGAYIPKSITLSEIAKFVFSALQFTWQHIRQKLVRVVGETTVTSMESSVDIVILLAKEGPIAAFDQIKEDLVTLKDNVIGSITDFVTNEVVQKAVQKIIGLFIPGAGFVSGILSIYDMVMVFVQKLSTIMQVAKSFIDSISNIAKGAILTAANNVEKTLAGLLSLSINFFAGFIGVGKISDKIFSIINKLISPVDRALNVITNWLLTLKLKYFNNGNMNKQKMSDIREIAGNAVRSMLGSRPTLEETERAIWKVENQLRPQGLKRIFLATEKDNGERDVFAEASPPKKIMTLAPSAIVGLEAKIVVVGKPVLSGLARRTLSGKEGAIKFTPLPEKYAPILNNRRIAQLGEVTMPPGLPSKRGFTQPSSGYIIEPDPDSHELEILAWNTGDRVRNHNPSHAEIQFIHWFDNRPAEWQARVKSGEVVIYGRDICPLCQNSINGFRNRYPMVNFKRGD